MTTTTPLTDEVRFCPPLACAAETIATASGDVTIDFSAVHRADQELLQQLEALASLADRKAVKITLRNVNIDVYKVLKLMKLTRRLSFAS